MAGKFILPGRTISVSNDLVDLPGSTNVTTDQIFANSSSGHDLHALDPSGKQVSVLEMDKRVERLEGMVGIKEVPGLERMINDAFRRMDGQFREIEQRSRELHAVQEKSLAMKYDIIKGVTESLWQRIENRSRKESEDFIKELRGL